MATRLLPKPRRRAAALLTALLASAARAEEVPPTAPATAPATATTVAAPDPTPNRRELAGHTFQPTLGVTSAFATTSFATYLTAGYGRTEGTVELLLPGNTEPTTYSGNVDYAAIGGAMAYEVAFLDHYSVRLGITETLFTGTTGAAAAAVGTNARLGAGLGLTASFPVGETVQLAAVVDASYAPKLGLILGPALEDAYQSCQSGLSGCTFDFDKLFQQQNVFTVQPGVAASWVPWRPLGVTGNVGWSQSSLAKTDQGTRSAGAVTGALALDLDLAQLTPVALGIQATVATQVPVSGDSSTRFTDVGGGLTYTGRPNLAAGVQVLVRRFAVTPTVDVSWATVIVVTGLRYYW